ncbi:glycosyltransferase family 2 protein [Cetobacterium somerae]|uniref:glycosyltransferase family 2 protein n=1 Tax=Cetobacterium somerae TaxID=188913 RepID=UPI00224F8497|nr:glycosyltransferase family 2 protein [Cetobacterium somerae]MCX3067000.1 glycosyltransferase family 2 protein [Cetobacterium somerae]
MKNNLKVEILMATYNGEDYIVEQIESLLNQTYNNWNLLIRDDGSKDRTIEKIEKFEKKYPNKIKLLKDNKGGLRAKDNFLELLKNSKENYIMFCDQDDVWLPNKIELTLKKMLEVEDGPTLIHTDLKVVDDELNILANSFWQFQNLNPNRKTHNYLIVQNNITGCTMMINRELADLSNGNFFNGIMHDWVIAIIASLKGKIDYINESTILYRQHEKNDIGAKDYNLKYFIKKFLRNKEEIKNNNLKIKKQLLDIKNKNKLENSLNKELDEYLELNKKNKIYQKAWLIKNNYLKNGIYRKIGQMLF